MAASNLEALIGRGLIGFPKSEILAAKSLHNEDSLEAWQSGGRTVLLTVLAEDGRTLSIPKTDNGRMIQATYER